MIIRDAESIVKRVENAKVIVFGCGIEASSTEAKGVVLLKGEIMHFNSLLGHYCTQKSTLLHTQN